MAIELTDRVAREVRTDRPDRGMRLHWDSAVKGFGLRITRTGAAAWVLNFRSHGIQRQLTIGSFPDLTAKAAREQAKALKRDIDMGVDPMADRHADRKAPTMNDLAAHYIAKNVVRNLIGDWA